MTEDSKAYWAWLQLSLGEGSFKPKRILSYFPDIPSFYDAGPTQWRSLGLFTPKELKQLSQNTLEDGKVLMLPMRKKEFKPLLPLAKRILKDFTKLTILLACCMLRVPCLIWMNSLL